MTFPPGPAMLALLAHAAGETFTVCPDTGELHLTVRSEWRTMVAPPNSLDELEELGWVALRPDDTTVITERGKYRLDQWLVSRLGKGRLRRMQALRVERSEAA